MKNMKELLNNKYVRMGLAALVVVGLGIGGFFYWAGHRLDKVVQGKTYQYSSVLDGTQNDKMMYVTFQNGGNQVVVTQSREVALKAASSPEEFKKSYEEQSAEWRYAVTPTTLTLGKKENDELSQWQYNSVFAFGDQFTSDSFTYQIAKGGQGEVRQKMVFKEVQ
ncbi:hypothetical protein ACXM1Q_008135 [Streptococcus sp. 10F2]